MTATGVGRSVGLSPPLAGPAFSTFAAADVAWLLTDFSDIALENDPAEREVRIQSGAEHYAETLPVEYRPTGRYLDAFDAALRSSSAPVADAAATLTADIHALHGPQAVIVSLARAGVPAGVWLRRLAARYYGHDWPHFAISIVRDRGLDLDALAWLVAHYDPARLLFVDAWTGKGAIRDELSSGLQQAGALAASVPDILAVLADPAGVADFAGTRKDLLIPSACLNATVSGLVSRTVLPQPGRGPRHGAKFYRELADADRTADLVETVLASAPEAPPAGHGLLAPNRTATDLVARISRDFALPTHHLVKPGIGEATRVLLRRVPWRVRLHPDAREDGDLRHILELAHEREVPVVDYDTAPYRVVGVIRPNEAGDL